MDSKIYSAEVLEAKKYGELLKVAKSIGARTTNEAGKRLKTAKLIEYILEAQSANCNTENATAVADALKDENNTDSEVIDQSTEKTKPQESDPTEELLSDIQFPSECEEELPEILEHSNKKKETSKKDRRSKRHRTKTFELDDKESSKSSDTKETDNKRRRTSTFDVAEVVEENVTPRPKRRRTSTFEVAKQNVNVSQSDEAKEDTAVENDQQLQALTSQLSRIRNQKQSSDSPSVLLKSTDKRKSRSRTPVSKNVTDKEKLPSNAPESKVLQKSVTKQSNKTPKTPKLTGRKSVIGSLVKTDTRKSVLASGKKFPTGTPASNKKELPASKIMKPLFTVGSDTSAKEESEEAKQGSNIPRFVAFARKYKVPNFAKIHEKAFNRMQALDEYLENRRNVSTKKTKPTPASGEIFKPAVTSVANLNLNFADAASSKSPAKSLMDFNKGKSSEIKQKKQNKPVSEVKSAKKSPELSLGKTTVKVGGSKLKSPSVQVRKSPRARMSSIKSAAFIGSARKSPVAKSTTPKATPRARYSTLPRPLKENIKPARHSIASPAPGKINNTLLMTKTPGSAHKRAEYDPKASLNKPVNYVPYKGALKPLTNADVHKAMGEKVPKVKSSKQRREDQQKILKGVRFNKRFELQMAKRGISLS